MVYVRWRAGVGPLAAAGGARVAWTGDVPFWEDQVKQMMSANIDILYVI